MSSNNFSDSFSNGLPAGVSNVARDSGGRLLGWMENGFLVTVVRDPSTNKPAQVVAQRGGYAGRRLVMGINWSVNGLAGTTGDIIPTVLRSELLGEGLSSVSGGGALTPMIAADQVQRGTFYKGSRGRQICIWPSITASGGTVGLVADVPSFADGATQSIEVTQNAAVSTGQAAVAVANYTPTANGGANAPNIGIWIKNSGARPLDFRVRLWNVGTTRSIVYQGAARASGAWEFYAIPSKGTTIATWTFPTDAVSAVRVEQFDAGPNGAWQAGEKLRFGPVYADCKARPRFMLTFDDVPSNVYRPYALTSTSPVSGRSAKDMLDFYGFRGTVYLSKKVFANSSTGATAADVNALLQDGWAVGHHSASHPVNLPGAGLRLLGPYGFNLSRLASNGVADCRVTATATGTNIFTCEGTHNLALSSKIQFTTAAPTGFSTGTTYWIIPVAGTTFKVALTESDAYAGTAIAVGTAWTGTAEWQWPGSTNDDTAIYNDIVAGDAWVTAQGISGHSPYFALPQGGWDYYVMSAIARIPTIRHTRGVASVGVTCRSLQIGRCTGGTVSNSPYLAPGWPEQPDAITTEGGANLAQAQAYVDECITYGYTGANYHHDCSANADILDGLLSYLKTKSDAGLIDVVTVWDELNLTRLW